MNEEPIVLHSTEINQGGSRGFRIGDIFLSFTNFLLDNLE